MKIDSVLLFEDIRVDHLYPFSIMHSSWELRCGAFRQFERVERLFAGSKIFYSGRDKHVNSFKARFKPADHEFDRGNVLILYTGLFHDFTLAERIRNAYDIFSAENGEKTVIFKSGIKPIAGFIPADELINPSQRDIGFLPRLVADFSDTIPQIDIPGIKYIEFLWDALEHNSFALENDFNYFSSGAGPNNELYPRAYFVKPDRISIGSNCSIAPGVVIDASDGPVIIGSNVRLMPNAVIMGPAYIGDNSLLKIGAKIYGGTSIGEFCKIGGEVENSIIQAYSNKQHEGFLGHSFLSEWINFGADTNTSDLKNTYGNIKIQLENYEIDSGRMFLGILCGDHTKSGINTMFTTGTVAGICGNIFGAGYPPSYIPSFMWDGIKEKKLFKLEKALEVADTVMKRRGKNLLPEEAALIEAEHVKSKIHYVNPK